MIKPDDAHVFVKFHLLEFSGRNDFVTEQDCAGMGEGQRARVKRIFRVKLFQVKLHEDGGNRVVDELQLARIDVYRVKVAIARVHQLAQRIGERPPFFRLDGGVINQFD